MMMLLLAIVADHNNIAEHKKIAQHGVCHELDR